MLWVSPPQGYILPVFSIERARNNGYAPAIVVDEFKSPKAFKLNDCETKFIPCPAQTMDKDCVTCKLCFKSEYLYKNNIGIAFAAHGIKKDNLKRRLKVI